VGNRRPSGGRDLVAQAARLCGLSRVDAADADGAVVITVTGAGVPIIAHNMQNRADLPLLLRTIADGLEHGITGTVHVN
jgi:hypothetical protein